MGINQNSVVTEINTSRANLSDDKYHKLFKMAGDGILLIQEERFIDCNPSAAKMLGYDNPLQVIGKRPCDISPPTQANGSDSEAYSTTLTQTAYQAPQIYDWIHLRKDGEPVEVEVSLTVLDYDTMTLLVHWRDNTEIRRAQAAEKRMEKEIKQVYLQVMQSMSLALEKRDPYTAGHQIRVSELIKCLAEEMALDPFQVEGLIIGSTLHDIGKISVPAEILNRPGRLSDVEMELIKQHPKTGYEITKDVDFPWPVADMIRQHHERWDGSGYPQGLAGEDIILEARIIAVADVVEAIASHRPYRAALGIDVALEEIRDGAGKRYDPNVVDACLKVFAEGFILD